MSEYIKLETQFKLDFADVLITKYKSVSGISIVHVDIESPIVNGYFALSTEILNDSGVPHTLEHLCFLGSRKWPYKAALDQLAAKAYGYTNA